jgi:hypothetical protein
LRWTIFKLRGITQRLGKWSRFILLERFLIANDQGWIAPQSTVMPGGHDDLIMVPTFAGSALVP